MQAVLLVSPEQVSQDIHVATVSWSGLEQCRHPRLATVSTTPYGYPPHSQCQLPCTTGCMLLFKWEKKHKRDFFVTMSLSKMEN